MTSASALATIDELRQAVASTSPRPLRVTGAGTKRPFGVAGEDADTDTLALPIRGLVGVVAYDPAECVVTALAGTPVRTVSAALAAHGQYLPWDPPLVDAGATVGGMVAAGLSGPGRYRYGGVRDFVIGAKVVDGRGRVITSGGQVVKNAAGFLLHHAMVGSAGRLGVLVEVSTKVFPRPEATRTVVARHASLGAALAAYEHLRATEHDVDALELVADTATVLVRLGGAPTPVSVRAQHVQRIVGVADTAIVDGTEEHRLWSDIDVSTWQSPFVLKVPTTPSRLAGDLATVKPLGRCRVSVGGAVIYVACDGARTDADDRLRQAGLRAAVVTGPSAGAVIGRRRETAFADRVAAVLDPERRFR